MDNSSVLAYEMPENRGEFVLQRDPLVEKVDAEANNGPEFDLRARMINTLFSIQYGSEEALEKFNKLSEVAHEAEMENVLEDSILLFAANKGLSGIPEDFQNFVIEISGIPSEALEERWRQGRGSQNEHLCKRDNAEAIAKLELLHPGSAKTLTEEFGIYNFSRYPSEVLIKQFEKRNDKEVNYGIGLFAAADHTGNFIDARASKDSIKQMASILEQEDKILRIYEVKNAREATRALLSARYKYGQKIGHSILQAHGNEDVIVLGLNYYTDDFIFRSSINALGGRSKELFANLFEEDSTLILNSCCSGAEEAIGEQVSNLLNVDVLAPTSSSYLKSVRKIDSEIVANFDSTNTRAISPTRALT